MRFLFLALMVSGFVSPGFASDCFELVGQYAVQSDGDCYVVHEGRRFNDYVFQSMRIDQNRADQTSRVTFNVDKEDQAFFFDFLVDGQDHEGHDPHSKYVYTASCDGDVLSVMMQYKVLRQPFEYRFQRTESGLSFSELRQDGKFERRCEFSEAH